MTKPGSPVAPKISGPAQPFAPDSALASCGPSGHCGPQLVVARPVHRTLPSYSTCSDTGTISLVLQATTVCLFCPETAVIFCDVLQGCGAKEYWSAGALTRQKLDSSSHRARAALYQGEAHAKQTGSGGLSRPIFDDPDDTSA
jgi:hypothetical protein